MHPRYLRAAPQRQLDPIYAAGMDHSPKPEQLPFSPMVNAAMTAITTSGRITLASFLYMLPLSEPDFRPDVRLTGSADVKYSVSTAPPSAYWSFVHPRIPQMVVAFPSQMLTMASQYAHGWAEYPGAGLCCLVY